MLANILFWGGIVVAVLGGINIIRFDGSIKRVIVSAVAIIAGLACLAVGQGQRNNIPVEYQITEVQALNNDNSKYRVTLKAGSNSTILYVDANEVGNFK